MKIGKVSFKKEHRQETIIYLALWLLMFMAPVLSLGIRTAYNENKTLIPGTKVFIHAKKKQATKGMDIFVVDEDGITLRDIAQRYGVRLDAIVKLNGLSPDYVPAEGDVLKMRKTR